jgi:O-antigen/teichoic acid export membrane protein
MTAPKTSTPSVPIGIHVQGSALWMIANTGFAKLFGFAAQIAMGWLLSQNDFALYAIAISVSAFAALLSDTGLRNLLIQRHGEYDRLEGPVFWLSLALNTSAAVVLIGIAPLVSDAYGEPTLLNILLVAALATVLATPTAVLSAKLRVNLQFKALSLIQIGSSLLRYGCMVMLAWLGYGPLSFVIPVVLTNLFEGIATWSLTRTTPWRKPIGLKKWPETLRETRWILIGAFSIGVLNNGLYLALGSLVPKSVVAIYFFAYQIIVQVGLLLSHNLFQVLFPAFSKLANDPCRSRSAIERALRVVMLAATLGLILVPLYGPLEQLVWHGKWKESVQPVQLLCVFYPTSVLLSIAMASQAARGQFRSSALMTLALAGGTITAGLTGAYIFRTASGIAFASGLFTFFGSLAYLISTLKAVELPVIPVITSVLKIWGVGMVAAGLSLLLDTAVLSMWAREFRILVDGSVFLIVFGILARIILPDQLKDAADIIPAPIRIPFLGLMRLSTQERTS